MNEVHKQCSKSITVGEFFVFGLSTSYTADFIDISHMSISLTTADFLLLGYLKIPYKPAVYDVESPKTKKITKNQII
jgi:hypothetical protein